MIKVTNSLSLLQSSDLTASETGWCGKARALKPEHLGGIQPFSVTSSGEADLSEPELLVYKMRSIPGCLGAALL